MSKDQSQKDPAPYESGQPYQVGQDPEADAWYTVFFIENHLDYLAYPDQVASPEQVRFMAYTEENERYYPCSDRMFWTIMKRQSPPYLKKMYEEALHKVLGNTREYVVSGEMDRAFDEFTWVQRTCRNCHRLARERGLLPTKGLTLPLMSYGGSSMVVMCVAIALLLRIDGETRCTLDGLSASGAAAATRRRSMA